MANPANVLLIYFFKYLTINNLSDIHVILCIDVGKILTCFKRNIA